MLVAQGKIIFFNEAYKSSDYFASIGYECPAMSNPADYFMTIMSPENPADDISDDDEDDNGKPVIDETQILREYSKKINDFVEEYNKSQLKNDYAYVSKEVVPIHSSEIQSTGVGWFTQLWLLTYRSLINIMRLPEVLILRFGGTVASALLVDIMYQQLKGNLQGVQDRNGCLFFVITCISFNSILATILLFPEERPIFLREAHNKMYTVSAYFFGKLLSEMPCAILAPILHTSILYFPIGLNTNTPWKFPIHCFIQALIYFAGCGYTLIISVAFSDKKLAVSLIPILLAPFMLLSGFIVPSSAMPFWLRPLNSMSFYRYGY
jgi:ABC-type multidrug transport system permease subunit